MLTSAKRLSWLIIPLFLGGIVSAQVTIETPAQKTKDAVDKLEIAPNAARKSLQEFGKTVSPKLGAAGETKPIAANAENPSASEKKPEEPLVPRISPLGKRDPFRPFTLNARSSAARRRENLSPLERYELGQLKLVGVIWDVKESNALVEDSAGLGYRVKVGTPIGSNDGKVKGIQRDGIVVEEFYVDLYGAKNRREVKMRLSPEKAE